MSFSFLKIAFKIQDRKIVCVVKNGCRKNTLFWGDILSSGKKKGRTSFKNDFLLLAFNFPRNDFLDK